MLNLDAVRTLEPVSGGAATSMWRVNTRSRSYALRVFRAHERRVLERELIVHAAAAQCGLPVPNVYAAGSHAGRPALLLDWCTGGTIVSALASDAWRVWQLGVAFGRLHATIHGVDAPANLRASWIDWPAPAEPTLAARLRAEQQHARLLHLDYHPLNVLTADGRMTAVLDWTNAHAGDPRADVARTVSILRLMPLVERQTRRERLAIRVFELAYRRGYGRLGPSMELFHAWAGGAMLHDLGKRYPAERLAPVQRWTAMWRRRSRLR